MQNAYIILKQKDIIMRIKKHFIIGLFICAVISSHGTIISMHAPQLESQRSLASRIIPESIQNWYSRSQSPTRRRLKIGFYMGICGLFALRIFRMIRPRRRMIGFQGLPFNPTGLNERLDQIRSVTAQLRQATHGQGGPEQPALASHSARESLSSATAQTQQGGIRAIALEDKACQTEGDPVFSGLINMAHRLSDQMQTEQPEQSACSTAATGQPVIESLPGATDQPLQGSSTEQRRKTF